MRISTRTRYGLRAMAELAGGQPDAAISLKEVSQRQHISLKYLEQVVATLKNAGLVNAVRGYHGGYILARAPEKISLREVFVALEGSPTLVDCVGDADVCPLHSTCPTRETWIEMSRALDQVLGSTTVGDLLQRCAQETRPAAAIYVI